MLAMIARRATARGRAARERAHEVHHHPPGRRRVAREGRDAAGPCASAVGRGSPGPVRLYPDRRPLHGHLTDDSLDEPQAEGLLDAPVPVVARNSAARAVKAPPVMKTMRLASAGRFSRSSSKRSMPLIPGIIRSQKMTSKSRPVDRGQRVAHAGRRGDVVLRAEELAHRVGDRDLVVDDEHPRRAGRRARRGRVARSAARPRRSSRSVVGQRDAERRPLVGRAVDRDAARRATSRSRGRSTGRGPCPTPRGLVVKNGSKMRGRISWGMPSPLSVTSRTTRVRRRRGAPGRGSRCSRRAPRAWRAPR